MSQKTPQELLNHYLDRLGKTLEEYRTAFETYLWYVQSPADQFPSGYIHALDHYMRMFMEYNVFPPDTLIRLYHAKLCPESVNIEDTKRILDFNALLREMTYYITGVKY